MCAPGCLGRCAIHGKLAFSYLLPYLRLDISIVRSHPTLQQGETWALVAPRLKKKRGEGAAKNRWNRLTARRTRKPIPGVVGGTGPHDNVDSGGNYRPRPCAGVGRPRGASGVRGSRKRRLAYNDEDEGDIDGDASEQEGDDEAEGGSGGGGSGGAVRAGYRAGYRGYDEPEVEEEGIAGGDEYGEGAGADRFGRRQYKTGAASRAAKRAALAVGAPVVTGRGSRSSSTDQSTSTAEFDAVALSGSAGGSPEIKERQGPRGPSNGRGARDPYGASRTSPLLESGGADEGDGEGSGEGYRRASAARGRGGARGRGRGGRMTAYPYRRPGRGRGRGRGGSAYRGGAGGEDSEPRPRLAYGGFGRGAEYEREDAEGSGGDGEGQYYVLGNDADVDEYGGASLDEYPRGATLRGLGRDAMDEGGGTDDDDACGDRDYTIPGQHTSSSSSYGLDSAIPGSASLPNVLMMLRHLDTQAVSPPEGHAALASHVVTAANGATVAVPAAFAAPKSIRSATKEILMQQIPQLPPTPRPSSDSGAGVSSAGTSYYRQMEASHRALNGSPPSQHVLSPHMVVPAVSRGVSGSSSCSHASNRTTPLLRPTSNPSGMGDDDALALEGGAESFPIMPEDSAMAGLRRATPQLLIASESVLLGELLTAAAGSSGSGWAQELLSHTTSAAAEAVAFLSRATGAFDDEGAGGVGDGGEGGTGDADDLEGDADDDDDADLYGAVTALAAAVARNAAAASGMVAEYAAGDQGDADDEGGEGDAELDDGGSGAAESSTVASSSFAGGGGSSSWGFASGGAVAVRLAYAEAAAEQQLKLSTARGSTGHSAGAAANGAMLRPRPAAATANYASDSSSASSSIPTGTADCGGLTGSNRMPEAQAVPAASAASARASFYSGADAATGSSNSFQVALGGNGGDAYGDVPASSGGGGVGIERGVGYGGGGGGDAYGAGRDDGGNSPDLYLVPDGIDADAL